MAPEVGGRWPPVASAYRQTRPHPGAPADDGQFVTGSRERTLIGHPAARVIRAIVSVRGACPSGAMHWARPEWRYQVIVIVANGGCS